MILNTIQFIFRTLGFAILFVGLSILLFYCGLSIYPVWGLYILIAFFGFYKKIGELPISVFLAFMAHMAFYYWAAYWIGQIN